MKKMILCILLTVGLIPFSGLKAEGIATANLIPVPAKVEWGSGALTLDSKFSIALKGAAESRVQGAVKRFADRLGKRTGVNVSGNAGSSDEASLVIEVADKGLPVQTVREDESYTLTVTPKQVKLSAPTPLGALHGLQTLLQLVRAEDKGWAFPSVTIQDKPRFAWRGLMIDACRHWQPMEVILRNLDGMEEAKLNVLHWHLSEDQGFRVESFKLPKLQEKGSDGKYYTQKQIKQVVDYARERGIRVVPEFDMPGHCTAILTAYPELASQPGPIQMERDWGIFYNCMNPSNEAVYTFLDTFVGEMTSLFPDEYYHIGGDEVNGVAWNSNLDIRDFMVEHDLRTNADLQAYFNSRLSKIVTKYKKKVVGWDEILQPDLPKTIVIQSWRGADSLVNAAQKGCDGILSSGYYLDMIQPASDHYIVDPLPTAKKKDKPVLTDLQAKHVLGGEACMWSEFVGPDTIDSRIWPRTLAVAERLWSPASVRDIDDFYRRMEAESGRLTEVGLTHETHYPIMLKHLAADGPTDHLKVLADVVEPVKYYHRGQYRKYNQAFPLDRLVDVAHPDSRTARHFRIQVDEFLAKAPELGKTAELETQLKAWASNHAALEPVLLKSDLARESALISKGLSEAGQVGLEAVQYLSSGKAAPSDWSSKANKVLDAAQKPDEAVQIVVIEPIRKLVLAASRWDKLKEGKGAQWLKALEEQVKAVTPHETMW
jgi:hexosaminidase